MVLHDLVLVLPPHQCASYQLPWWCFLFAQPLAIMLQRRLTRSRPLPSFEVFVAVQRGRLDLLVIKIRECVFELLFDG